MNNTVAIWKIKTISDDSVFVKNGKRIMYKIFRFHGKWGVYMNCKNYESTNISSLLRIIEAFESESMSNFGAALGCKSVSVTIEG